MDKNKVIPIILRSNENLKFFFVRSASIVSILYYLILIVFNSISIFSLIDIRRDAFNVFATYSLIGWEIIFMLNKIQTIFNYSTFLLQSNMCVQ